MQPIQLLHATNVISRQKHRLQQDLAFVMLVENQAYDKWVEVRWAGEDKVWRTLQAEYLASGDASREIWRARESFVASDDASLPGDIEFTLRYRVRGRDFWDDDESRNYFLNADSGVLLHPNVQLIEADYAPP